MALRTWRGVLAVALFIAIGTASMPALCGEMEDYIAAQIQKCKELTRMRDELAQKAAQSGPADAKMREDLNTLNSLVDHAQTLVQQPPPKSAEERAALAKTLYNVGMAANMAAHDVKRDLGDPAFTFSRAESALPADTRDFTTKVSKGFDGTASSYNPDVNASTRVPDTDFFVWSGRSQAAAAPAVTSEYKRTSPSEAANIVKRDGGVDGGVVLESSATDSGSIPGLGPIVKLQYDSSLNALVLNDQATYFLRIQPWVTAVLCREIASDPNAVVGVSLTGDRVVVSGTGNKDSFQDAELTHDLVLADRFLGDIAFGENNWSAGYRFPDGYTPQTTDVFQDMVVRSAFDGFQFRAEKGKLRPTHADLEIRLIPITKSASQNGGMLPDEHALAQGYTPPAAFAANVQNISGNVDYYQRERIVSRTFAYGEAAALFRSLKAQRFDLEKLARAIGTSMDDVGNAGEWTGAEPVSEAATPASLSREAVAELNNRLDKMWADYLKGLQADGPAAYPNWSGPPYDIFVKTLAEKKARNTPTYRVVGVRADDVLNIRSGPGPGYPIVGTIPPDGRGVRMSNSCDGTWCRVSYGRAEGWVNRTFLTLEPSQNVSYRVVHVAANDVLNMRRGPAVRYPVTSFIPPDGQGVRILGQVQCVEGWCAVDYNGAQGWVNTLFLAAEQAAEATYRVFGVADDDVLNIRSGPGASSPIVGSIPPNGRGVRIVGSCAGQWCQIDYRGSRGWVNRLYLSADL